MDNRPEKPRHRWAALRDLLLISLAVVALLWVGSVLDVLGRIEGQLRQAFPGHEDDLLLAFALAAIGLALFSVLRSLDAKRQARARSAVESRYRALVEGMPAVTYTWDPRRPAGTLPPPYVSPQVEAILGFSPEEWQADPQLWIRQIHRDDQDRVLAASARADRSGEPFGIEYRHQKKDGTQIWVREEAIVVERDASGAPTLVQGVMYDITERRRAEEHVAEAEARYRTLVERVPAVTYIWDASAPAGTIPAPYISPQVEQLTGYSPEEFDDPTLWDRLVHPDDRARVLQEWEAIERGEGAFRSEYRIYRKDKQLVWIRDEAVPVSHDEQGHPTFQGVMFDITERKETERRLLEAEERFRTLVEQIPAITYIEDPTTGDALYISPQIETVFGYTPEEWIADGMLWERTLHPDDRAWVVAENDADTGDRWSVDYRAYAKDGRPLWVHNESALVRGHDGTPLFWQGVMMDVTERKESEQRLLEAEAKYRTLVEQLPVVVYQDAVDDDSTALYISPQYERLFGFAPEVRMSDPGFWVEHIHPDDRDRVLAESRRTNSSGEPFVEEYRFLARDGRIVWVRDEATLLHNQAGEAMYWQGVLMDITERRLADEALARRDAVLEAVSFAAGHFLKTPAWEDSIVSVLGRLGLASQASRAYVYENGIGPSGELTMSERYEWAAPGVRATVDDPANHAFPYVAGGFTRWMTALGSGTPIHCVRSEAPEAEGLDMDSEDILSIAAVPVFVEGDWWGFIGFDDCRTERRWTTSELDVLSAAADTLGAAIGRERAERRQAETERRYRTLVEQIPAVTYIHAPMSGGGLFYISPQIERVLGYTQEEWTADGESWFRTLHPDDRDRVLAEDRRTDDTGEPLSIEYRQIAKDGREVWTRDEAVLVRDDRGEPMFWQGVRFDISAQKRTEEQLREAEGRYRTLVENLPAVTYIDAVDEHSTTVYVSPQVEEMFGYTPEEWKASPELWIDALHPGDRGRVLEAARLHNTTGVPFEIEYRFRTNHGTWRWIRDQAVVVRGEDGRIMLSQGVMFDVTERLVAEEQLRETEARYRAIVEHVPAAIYVDEPDGSMLTSYVSPHIHELMGVTPEEYRADPEIWLTLMAPEQREEMRRSYLEAVVERRSWVGEYRIRTPDGRDVWIHDESTFVMDENDEPLFLQGVMFDVTERKLAEQALQESERQQREAAERLRALDDMKNTFLAAVSHELRSPLTSILGLSLTLEQTELPSEDRSDLLGRLAANARKLDRLLKDLLDIDRLSRGIVTPKYRPTDLGGLVNRMVESLDVQGERSIIVEAESVVVPVDPAKVERIVENLLVNAVRHTPADRRIWVRVWSENGGVMLAVEDEGPGVPPELRDVIFEPFRQGPTPSAHSPGTGIGLSLVGMFAELHGGRAWVQEREGGGASFRVFLPGTPVEMGSTLTPLSRANAG